MATLRTIAIILLSFFFVKGDIFAQQKNHSNTSAIKLSEETIVYDSTGKELPYSVWHLLLQSGDFRLKKNDRGDFVLSKYNPKEKAFRDSMVHSIKPAPSTAFHDREPFYKIKTTDIYGDKINTKKLTGKILVINYWFINCAPCR